MQRGTAQVGVHAVLLGRACYGLLWHLATDPSLRLRLEWNQLGKRNCTPIRRVAAKLLCQGKHKVCRLTLGRVPESVVVGAVFKDGKRASIFLGVVTAQMSQHTARICSSRAAESQF
jgi:hypothetical protein